MSNDDLYKSGNELAWLDHVATTSRSSAIDIAKANANLTWGKEWLATRLRPDEAPADIAKAALVDVEKAMDSFDAELAAFEKAKGLQPGRGINKFMETDEGRDAYRKHAHAKLQAQALQRGIRRSTD